MAHKLFRLLLVRSVVPLTDPRRLNIVPLSLRVGVFEMLQYMALVAPRKLATICFGFEGFALRFETTFFNSQLGIADGKGLGMGMNLQVTTPDGLLTRLALEWRANAVLHPVHHQCSHVLMWPLLYALRVLALVFLLLHPMDLLVAV